MKKTIQEWMSESGVKFGTSGARGLATAMTDAVCHAYTSGFLQYLDQIGELNPPGTEVVIGGDFRPSTGRIMEAVRRAVADRGLVPVNAGRTPSPAVALYGLSRGIPSIMVTGSHIPDDRNGIKFNKCSGELLKEDEGGMLSQSVETPESLFDSSGCFSDTTVTPWAVDDIVKQNYVRRYLDVFPPDALTGLHVGVYQHSAVGRDVLVEILQGLGARVTALGRSETFIPVDTEAIRPEDVDLAARWASEQKFNAIVSADGDSDRPLVSDENGKWLRGDVAGVLCARFLGADSVCTPVSCNTALELTGWFKEIRRTRIGSPFVVAAMTAATKGGGRVVVGYEANGGFLLNSPVHLGGRTLGPLPTRDAVIVILSVLFMSKERGISISALAASLPPRFTSSGLLKKFAVEKSRALLDRFTTGTDPGDCAELERVFGADFGTVKTINRTDGIRVTFASGEIVHLRPSGNAPEFRCYTEASSESRAVEMTGTVVMILRQLSA